MTQYIKLMKDDELAHVGVMGMRWGKRSGGNSADRKEWGKQYKKASIQQFAHPVIAAKEQKKHFDRNKTISMRKTEHITDYNKGVDNAIAKEKAKAERRLNTPYRKTKIGASIVTGLFISKIASASNYGMSMGNTPPAIIAGTALGTISGVKMYRLLSDDHRKEE